MSEPAASTGVARPQSPVSSATAAPAAPPKPKQDFSAVAMVDEAPTAHAEVRTAKIVAFGPQGVSAEREYKRKVTLTGRGAIQVKTFHGSMSEDGLRRLDDKINDWLEAHPHHEVKFSTSTMGIWDGKTKEPAMIVSIWC